MTTSSVRQWRSASYSWDPGELTPAIARTAVTKALECWRVDEDDIGTAVLLTSEIVTNAVRHVRPECWSRGRVRTGVRLAEGRLEIEVADPDPHGPRPRAADEFDECFRGLAILAAYSERWGWRPLPHGLGKTVWWTQHVRTSS